MHAVRMRSLILACAIAVLAAGCGRNALSSPTGPTGLSDSSTFALDGSGDLAADASSADTFGALGRGGNGKGKGGENGKGKGPKDKNDSVDDGGDGEDEGEADEERRGPGHGNRGMLSGFVAEVGLDTLVVRGTTVRVEPTTLIRHGHRILTFDTIRIGDHVQARGAMDGAVLVATEIKVQDTGRDNAEAEGLVSGLTGVCPALTFTVGGTTVVTTTATTLFDGVTCAALADGVTVEVSGATQADGSIVATKVDVDLDDIEGVVSSLTGTCPALTLSVDTTAGPTVVTTDAATTFSEETCAAIVVGAEIEIEGVRQADGSIAARSIEIDLEELEGEISGLTGTCPALTFTLDGTTTVSTSAATVFTGVTCEALADGASVEVGGAVQTDGSVAAMVVSLD